MNSNTPQNSSDNDGRVYPTNLLAESQGGHRLQHVASSGHARQTHHRSSSVADLDTDSMSHTAIHHHTRGPASIDKGAYVDGMSRNLKLTPEQNNDLLQMIEVSPTLLKLS